MSGEYIIEYHQLGSQVRVAAVDPETGREAVIIGALGASQQELAQLAIRKLKYVLEKEGKIQ
jgi:hypothetical protein